MKEGRKIYLVPQTAMVQVQLEGTFAASEYEPGSEVVDSGTTDVGIDNQIGETDFEIEGWD